MIAKFSRDGWDLDENQSSPKPPINPTMDWEKV